MKLVRLLALLSVLSAITLSETGVAGSKTSMMVDEQIKQGKAIYLNFCATCHGRDARGNGPAAEELKIKPPSLRQIAKRHGNVFDPVQIGAVIDGRDMPRSHGTIEMPIWGNLFKYVAEVSDNLTSDSEATERHAQERILMLVEYLKTIQDK